MENRNDAVNEAMTTEEDLRNNNVNLQQFPVESLHWEMVPSGNFNLREGYYEDSLPDLTMLQPEYFDPSSGYEFVSDVSDWSSNLDNSEALMRQLSALGVRIRPEYLTLDLDATISRTASVSTASEGNNSWNEEELGSLPSPSQIWADTFESEIAEAEILANGEVIVSYDNLHNSYKPPLSLDRKFQDYLCLVQGHDEETKADIQELVCDERQLRGKSPKDSGKPNIKLLKIKLAILEKMNELKLQRPLSNLQKKCAAQIRRLKDVAEELNYDSTTPDSGVHDTFVTLSPDEQDKLRTDWKTELAKTEDEIQTLRQVLNSKVKHAHDLKRRLGITVWREFSDDLSSSIRSMKESPTVQKANEVFTEISDAVASAPLIQKANDTFAEFHGAVTSAPLYQKTAGAMSSVSEKTGAIFGGIGAKFGQLKETPTFKSFEERVGSVYTTAKSKVTGSESNSTQDFEEALREAEAEKAATTTATTDVVDVNQTVST